MNAYLRKLAHISGNICKKNLNQGSLYFFWKFIHLGMRVVPYTHLHIESVRNLSIHLSVHVFHALATALSDKKADTHNIGKGNIHKRMCVYIHHSPLI